MPWGKLLRIIRRLVQAGFLLFFLFLFRQTEYNGSDQIPYAVNLFFRYNPLVGISTMLAERQWITLLLPSLTFIVLTLLFGRFFCGWLCPLGTLIDYYYRAIRPKCVRIVQWPQLKIVVLLFILLSALFGMQFVGYVDPFAILLRALTFCLDPLFYLVSTSSFDYLYFSAPPWLVTYSEQLNQFLKATVLPFKQHIYSLSLLSFLMLAAIFALERYGQRFWCRNLCPLGALLAVIARFSLFHRFPAKFCKGCEQCAPHCRMSAFVPESSAIQASECNLCLDCIADCKNQPSRFRFRLPGKQEALNLQRRHLLQASAAATLLPLVSLVDARERMVSPFLLRPPGALAEKEFLNLCVRCGECMKVCLQNSLQPALWQAGMEGVFSPILIPRLGYCEYNCTLCGQVCPTGAIANLSLAEKHAFVIGKAVFDKNRCLPYASAKPCIVCEEHCPTGDKAIKFEHREVIREGKQVVLKQPYVDENLCVGCGICEKVCPLPDHAAVRVLRHVPASLEDENSGYS